MNFYPVNSYLLLTAERTDAFVMKMINISWHTLSPSEKSNLCAHARSYRPDIYPTLDSRFKKEHHPEELL